MSCDLSLKKIMMMMTNAACVIRIASERPAASTKHKNTSTPTLRGNATKLFTVIREFRSAVKQSKRSRRTRKNASMLFGHPGDGSCQTF